MFRHRSLPRTLPPARVGVGLQPSPAAAATTQIRSPGSSRLVCCNSSSVRHDSPAGCRDFESGRARDLMSSVVSHKSEVARRTIAVARKQTAASWISASKRSIFLGYRSQTSAVVAGPFQPRFLFAGSSSLLTARSCFDRVFMEICFGGLAFSKRDCRLRVCDSADPGGCHLFEVRRLRSDKLWGSLLGASGPCQHGRPLNTFCWTSAESQQDSVRSDRRNDEFDADALSFQPSPLAAGTDLRSLSLPAPSIHPSKDILGGGSMIQEKLNRLATGGT